MNVNECFDKGLLKRERKSYEKALRSVQAAKNKLKLSKRCLEAKIYVDSILDSYAAMFHAARALLYKDGIVEKSHYALFVYTKEVYSDKLEPRFINELNTLRLERHGLVYGLEDSEVEESEARDVLAVAEEFIKAIEKILGIKK